MTTPIFTSPFTGTVVQPTDVSYYDLSFSADVELYWPAVVNPTQVPAARIIDASTSTSGLSIALPQADQGTVGADILIRNKGATAFLVTDFDGGASVSIDPGISHYFYLTDNTTEAGVWSNVTFGAGTSSADAASLAGAGLTSVAGLLAVTGNIVQVSSPPTITDASRAATFVWIDGAGTFTLPNVSTLSTGWWIGFRNGGTGTLTIATQSPSLINEQGSLAINPNNSGFIFYDVSTGNFFTVGLASQVNPTFSSATYDVDSIVGSSLNLVEFSPNIQTYVALSGTRTTTLDVTIPAITQLYGFINDTASGLYDITFTISGYPGSTIVVPAGTVSVAVANGPNLFVISSTTTNIFYAANGSASNPSFSFTSDTTTGMYLVGTSILGLTANSTEMLNIDNTNIADPQVSTPATFNAKLIAGGTF